MDVSNCQVYSQEVNRPYGRQRHAISPVPRPVCVGKVLIRHANGCSKQGHGNKFEAHGDETENSFGRPSRILVIQLSTHINRQRTPHLGHGYHVG